MCLAMVVIMMIMMMIAVSCLLLSLSEVMNYNDKFNLSEIALQPILAKKIDVCRISMKESEREMQSYLFHFAIGNNEALWQPLVPH